MANRLVLGRGRGTLGSDYGLWVSKPTENVLTCGIGDLLYDSEGGTFAQVLLKGEAEVSTSSSPTFVTPSSGTGDYQTVIWQGSDGTTASSRKDFAEYGVSVAQTFSGSDCITTFSSSVASSIFITFIITTLRI